MRIMLRVLVGTVAVLIATKIVPGVTLDTPFTALVVAIVLGIANTVIRPILVILTLPVTVLTLGLFLLVVNACIVILADAIVPGFAVASMWSAMLFSMAAAIVGWFLEELGE